MMNIYATKISACYIYSVHKLCLNLNFLLNFQNVVMKESTNCKITKATTCSCYKIHTYTTVCK